MAQRQPVASGFLGHIVQDSPPQLRAQGAGIGLLTLLKHDLSKLGPLEDVLYPHFPAQPGNGRVIGIFPAETWVHRQRHQLKPFGQIGAQPGQRGQQNHRILSAGYAHADPVALLDHMIPVDGTAQQTVDTLHFLRPPLLHFFQL